MTRKLAIKTKEQAWAEVKAIDTRLQAAAKAMTENRDFGTVFQVDRLQRIFNETFEAYVIVHGNPFVEGQR
jgi:FMN-dependent NADH-azoreductase